MGHTGVGGVSLGGGIGWLMRKHGLTVDNLVRAEVVTAEGEIVQASASDHPDLFWALRGGGGNFGVVTSFRFALHPVGPTVMAGPVFWAAEDTGEVLRFYRDFLTDAPDELGNIVRLGTIPPLPVVDEELHFRPAIAVASCYAGPSRTVSMLSARSASSGHRSSIWWARPCTSTTRAAWTTRSPTAGTTTGRARALPTCRTRSSTSSPPTPMAPPHPGRTRPCSTWVARHAACRRAPRRTRGAMWTTTSSSTRSGSPSEDDTVRAPETTWARAFVDALHPHGAGVYVNFLDSDDDPSRVHEAYGDDTYRRLAEVKAKYDPDNLFHNNKNIPPRRAGALSAHAISW